MSKVLKNTKITVLGLEDYIYNYRNAVTTSPKSITYI